MNETQQNLALGETGADRFEALRRKSGLILAPVAFVGILAFPMESLSSEAHRLAAVLTLVMIFWVTEALPLAVTALLGPTLAVLLRVAPVGQAFAPMANPTIFLFLGSFILAQGLFVHRVNERIAHSVLSWKLVGGRPGRILMAYRLLAAFLSAWMSHTAPAGANRDVTDRLYGGGKGGAVVLRYGFDVDDRLRMFYRRNGYPGRNPTQLDRNWNGGQSPRYSSHLH